MPWVNPSKCDAVPWIYEDNPHRPLTVKPEKIGKWLVFVPESQVDEVWERIAEAVRNDRLGITAKVSTFWHSVYGSGRWDTRTRVICVYTKDYSNRKDVWRVREELRQMGFTKPLRYKTDNATKNGKYGAAACLIDEARGDSPCQKKNTKNLTKSG